MPLKVKICGITNLEDARFCAGAGADYLGFVQFPASPRFVEPEQARAILEWVYGPETVGVFVNETAAHVNRIAAATGFTMVQLHGDESPETCAQVERPVIKALAVGPETTVGDLREQRAAYAEHVACFLLDTRHDVLWGGTGQAFDWNQIRGLSDDVPFFLAGGLHAGNVEAAVRRVQPMGIDLSSGLEAEPGRKDFDKLTAFFEVLDRLRANEEITE